MRFDGDIIITDPCYICKDGDWEICEYGDRMDKLGLTKYISESTIYGDWSCTTFRSDTIKEKLAQLREKLDKMYLEFFSDYNNPEVYKTKENRKKMYDEYTARRRKVEEKSGMILGKFCADAGMVGVFLLDEVLKYNPDFNLHKKKLWTTTWIKDFHGEVEYRIKDGDEAFITGKGNINFVTSQSGF